jgi:Xaa-Pro aminopeptidase
MFDKEEIANSLPVKSFEEIKKIRRAQAIIDDVYDLLLERVREGESEAELAEFVKSSVLSLGGEDVSFDTIAAFGSGGAEPHHIPSEKRLEKGMLITVDMGAKYHGYCSDFTRTFAFGNVSAREKEIYNIVYTAQKEAVKAVAAGVRCADVDKAARDIIAKAGYGENYIHGTGHGVGTLIHEAPTLNARSVEVLENNMVVTVEPGIYVDGFCGVRIEDMLIVGNPAPLSRHSTELIIL